MNDIIISPCSKGDIPDLVNIAIASYREHYTHLWHDGGEEYLKRHFTNKIIYREWAEPDTAFFMLYFKGNLVGFMKLVSNNAFAGNSPDECLELERLYMIKAVSGAGIGTEAVAFALNYAQNMGKKMVWLKAMDSSADVIRFYERTGFRKCATFVLDTPEMKEEFRGMYVMQQELTVEGVSTLRKDFVTASVYQEEVSLA
ncbi:GNAT family N-acetyltransferase [Pontibacter qinzhouensis]|uniref:GNAT family N-acetyltransferase n=1 Tax=Pontibacter qinzhouensis TaxID=2603253 RepID=A0A5C8JG86_9BACT|nr:GNAT family N-acetyltransferase [Pontibacter qinzhouensis]TXK36749.1 GNAT family N-acetyltransferase [Pontibacter qinzhouensis]